jgi:CHAD domain-containing protein
VARAREVPGIDCGQPFAEAAARVVAVRSQEVIEHSRGVLDLADVERVHDMRVATRRLRAALEVFEPCFRGKRHRKAMKRVKAMADALGERRDRDVAIEFLESFAVAAPVGDRQAVATLIEQLRAEQVQANRALAEQVAAKRLGKLRRALERLPEATRR